jgi:hypothetical protein
MKRDERAATAPDRSPRPTRRAALTSTDIAHRAYDLYLARGCEHGHDVDDWVQAEREVQADAATE